MISAMHRAWPQEMKFTLQITKLIVVDKGQNLIYVMKWLHNEVTSLQIVNHLKEK